MTDKPKSNTDDSSDQSDPSAQQVDVGSAPTEPMTEQGPGWMPAILAATALMGIVGFIVCAFSTWLLFQKRTEFAIRTLRGAYIGEIEQSLLEPATKTAVVNEIKTLADDLERGKYENWQAASIMQRLQQLPVLQWGELQAVEAFLESSSIDTRDEQLKQISRLKRAVELGGATTIDVRDALSPVRTTDSSSPTGYELIQPMTEEQAAAVAQRCKLVGDREAVPNQLFDQVRLEAVVRRAIERGASEEGY